MSLTAVKSLTIAVAAAACVSCGGGGYSASSPSSPTPTSPATSSTSSALTISITSRNGAQSFSPNPASAGGQMVVFKNNDTIAHHVVLNDGTVDTGLLAPGATSAALLMPSAGANYHCTIHPDMTGSVNSASGSTAPPDSGGTAPPSGY